MPTLLWHESLFAPAFPRGRLESPHLALCSVIGRIERLVQRATAVCADAAGRAERLNTKLQEASSSRVDQERAALKCMRSKLLEYVDLEQDIVYDLRLENHGASNVSSFVIDEASRAVHC